jgi:hypothetical protein
MLVDISDRMVVVHMAGDGLKSDLDTGGRLVVVRSLRQQLGAKKHHGAGAAALYTTWGVGP